MSSQRYVQYGCGLSAPSTWQNFDVSLTLRLQKIPLLKAVLARSERFPTFPSNVEYGDIVKGLPVPDGSCAGVYCSHVLEHLSLEDLRTALRNTYRMLRPHGMFRLVLPDLKHLATAYVEANDATAAHRFMEDTYLGVKHRPRGLEGLLRSWMGHSAHLWMWDYPSLATELEAAGFTDIRRARYGDAQDPLFKDVENPGRWTHQLGIACKR